jgi:diguanylate cyclase
MNPLAEETPDTDHDPFAFGRQLQTPVWVFDTDNSQIVYANEAACAIWQAESEEALRERRLSDGMSATVERRLQQYQSDFVESDATFNEYWTIYPKDEPVTLKLVYSGFVLPDGRMAMLCEVIGQVVDEPATLRSAEALLHTDVMISLYSKMGAPLYTNPAARKAAPSARTLLSDLFSLPSDFEDMQSSWRKHGECRQVVQVQTPEGGRWHDLSVKCCLDAATGEEALLLTAVDVSELKTARDKARYLADRDQLTGCYNHAFMRSHLEFLCGPSNAVEAKYALLFLDIDKFKQVNDTYGHEVGDSVLRIFADRLKARIRSKDYIARMGGDEFVILIEGIEKKADLQRRIEELRAEVAETMDCGTVQLNVTTSIGVSMLTTNELVDYTTVMKQADIALYSSKRSGRDCYTFFNASLGAEVSERTWLEAALKTAIAERSFELFYQPRLDVATRRVVSVEGLLRWNHPERGFVAPDAFIPVCEEIGLISELGEFVMQEGHRQLQDWTKAGLDVGVSLNVSPRQFQDTQLIAHCEAIADHGGADRRHNVELEITESSLFDEDALVTEKIQRITELGFGVALDDFGTGYSNLAHISKFPLSCIKLDKSFVQKLPSSGPLLLLIIALARQIGSVVVAEGVETPEQLEWLAAHGCHQVQGFLFSKAVPASLLASTISNVEQKAASLLEGLTEPQRFSSMVA